MPVDPAVAGVLALRAQRNLPGYADITVEQLRAGAEMSRALQKPPQEVAAVIDAAYGPEPEQALRVYVPATGSAPYPSSCITTGAGS